MSEEPLNKVKQIQVCYSRHFPGLEEVLSGTVQLGDYFSFGSEETSMPDLQVQVAGQLSFPVPTSQAKKVIATAAEKAPYGRGADTLVDETVRKVWQIPPEKLTIGGKGWSKALTRIIARCADDLGCNNADVSAEFYKMLVYEKGGFFTVHRDSEKTGGMFGTLIIALPSKHTGGQLSIRHAGRETTLDMSRASVDEVQFAAFYADCEHEVTPITSGYRVCLVYNLVRKGGSTSTVPDNRATADEVATVLAAWEERGKPAKLVYLLDHHYTEAGLSFHSLKNGDHALGGIFKSAAAQTGCELHLGIVHIEESGWAEYSGYGHSRRDYGHYDDDDDDDFEVGEVNESHQYIDDWIDVNDTHVNFGRKWKPQQGYTPNDLGSVLQSLSQHGDSTLLIDCLRQLVPEHYIGGHNAALAGAFATLDGAGFAQEARHRLLEIFTVFAARNPAPCMELWNHISPTKNVATEEIANALIDKLATAQPPKSSYAHSPEVTLTPELCVDFILHLNLDPAIRCVAMIISNTKVFDLDNIILPALDLLHKNGIETAEIIHPLWQHSARHLLQRSSKPPAPPKDWKQSANWSCKCPECSILRSFAINANENILRIRLITARRQHMHQIVKDNDLDMTHETERSGRPFTLVFTKTRKVFKAKCAQHKQDIIAMKKLAKRPNSDKDIIDQLDAAIRLGA